MGRKLRRMFGSDCDHANTVVVTSVGVSRTVCESCGHISFAMSPELGTARRATARIPLRKVG